MDWARLLGVQELARAECAERARSAQAGVRGRAGEGAGVGAGKSARGALAAAARVWSAGGRASGRRRGLGMAWALGAWAGLGQCTRCTRPIFAPF